MAAHYLIIKNSAQCRICGDEIVSEQDGVIVTCKCGAIFVGGGKTSLYRGAARSGVSVFDIIDTSHVEAAEGWA